MLHRRRWWAYAGWSAVDYCVVEGFSESEELSK